MKFDNQKLFKNGNKNDNRKIIPKQWRSKEI